MMAAPPPAADAVARPLLLTLTEAGWEELQVNGTEVLEPEYMMTLPSVSVTVGTMLSEVFVAFVTASEIAWTGQDVKFTGILVALPIAANTGLTPGVTAVASTWFSETLFTMLLRPAAVLLSVSTEGLTACQLNCPTVEVISVVPPLYALASYTVFCGAEFWLMDWQGFRGSVQGTGG